MNSYLKERNHSIKINDYLSSLTPITHGVPQGSIIVPLLFIIFVNDLHLSTNLPIDMYADDSTLHTNGKTVAELNEKLTTAVSSVDDWCTSNSMAINEKKTKSMIIRTYQKETKIGCTDLNVYYNNKPLSHVTSEKLLRVSIDKHLLFKEHINDIASKLSKLIALLRRIKHYLPVNIRIIYYKVFFQPTIDYCNIVWGQSTHITRILKLQKLV